MYLMLTRFVAFFAILSFCVVSSASDHLVTVIGNVEAPGQYELPRDKDLRLLDVIALAGGTATSNANKVVVVRRLPGNADPAIITVSIAQAKAVARNNLILTAGDTISVEKSHPKQAPVVIQADDATARLVLQPLGANSTVVHFKSMKFRLNANGDPVVVLSDVSIGKDGGTLSADTVTLKIEQLLHPSVEEIQSGRHE